MRWPAGVTKNAVLSNDGRRRYVLSRLWNAHLPVLVVCMLNPSTADAETDDQTIRKLFGFASRWGYGGFLVVNLCPFRATRPKDLWSAVADQGASFFELENLAVQNWAFEAASDVVLVAWGDNCRGHVGSSIAVRIAQADKGAVCLGLTQRGCPRHPLMLPYETPVERWSAFGAAVERASS